MSNPKKSFYWPLGGAALVLLVLAVWWVNRVDRPAVHVTKTPVASTPPVPVASLSTGKIEMEKPAGVAATVPPATTTSTLPATAPLAPALAPAASAPSPAPVTTPADSTAAVNPAATHSEIEASARMYAAHAPLRVPEVADPDSASNKEILNTMVTKLITQPPRNPPPAVEPTKS